MAQDSPKRENLARNLDSDPRFMNIVNRRQQERRRQGLDLNDPTQKSIYTESVNEFKNKYSEDYTRYQQQTAAKKSETLGRPVEPQEVEPKKIKIERPEWRQNPTQRRAKKFAESFSTKVVFESNKFETPQDQSGRKVHPLEVSGPSFKPSIPTGQVQTVANIAQKAGIKQAGSLASGVSKITGGISNVAKSAVGKVFGQAGLAVAGKLGGAIAGVFSGPIGWALTAASLVGSKTFRQAAIGIPAALGMMIAGAPAAFGAAAGAAASAVGTAVGISILGGAILVAFFMFIINSGAYMVPPGSGGIGGVGGRPVTSLPVGAECPIPGGRLLWGSYGTSNGSVQHGTNEYWGRVPAVPEVPGFPCTDYALAGCYSRQTGDQCAPLSTRGYAQCATYGYAADFVYPGGVGAGVGKPVYLPYIEGEPVTWELVSKGTVNGTLRAIANGIPYEMFVSHIGGGPRGGSSGERMGLLDSAGHLHVELKVNGDFVMPDAMCSGTTGGTGSGSGTSGGTIPACSTAGGECLSTPNCDREGRSPVNGLCSNNTLCCSKPVIINTCIQNNGKCENIAAQQLLYPGLDSCDDIPGRSSVTGSCSTDEICCNKP